MFTGSIVRFFIPFQDTDQNVHIRLLCRINTGCRMTQYIWKAIKNNDVQALSRILDRAPPAVEVDLIGIFTPLTFAAQFGHMEATSLLLDRGASLTATDSSGANALYKAAEGDHYELLEFLLRRGADARTKDKNGVTVLMRASARGCAATVRRLIPHFSKVELNERDLSGKTALHTACRRGHSEVVRILLLAGLDSTAAANSGTTPQAIAIARGHQTCAAVFDVSAYWTRLCLSSARSTSYY
jgi:ankyrin repeat protein